MSAPSLMGRIGEIIGNATMGGIKQAGQQLGRAAMNPLKTLGSHSSSLSTLNRIGAGAALGAGAGMIINAATGIAGSIASIPTFGGLNNSSFSGPGSMINAGITGGIVGAGLMGGGFKNVGGRLQMRSGMKAASEVIGDLAPSMSYKTARGLGVSRNSALGQVLGNTRHVSGARMGTYAATRSAVSTNSSAAKQTSFSFMKEPSFRTNQVYQESLNEGLSQAAEYNKKGRFSSAWNTGKRNFKEMSTGGKIGMAASMGGLGYGLYQTNALGVSIPGNRGYR